MHLKLLISLVVACSLPSLGLTQQDPTRSERQESVQITPSAKEQNQAKDGPAKDEDKEKQEVQTLIRDLESTIEELSRARTQAGNVKKIVDQLDSGEVKATDKEMVKTNQFVRTQMAKDFRELRAKARSVGTQINTVLLPKQRGLSAKLKTRWELESDASIKPKIAKLLSEHEEVVTETQEQLRKLESNIKAVGDAIQMIEQQLNYLQLVEESLGLGKRVSDQMRELNKEIDKVLATLAEKEVRQ